MNTRSIRFQLVAWYAGLLTGVRPVLCGRSIWPAEFAGRRAAGNPVAAGAADWPIVARRNRADRRAGVGEEIQARYAPDINGRFIRITRGDGSLLYVPARPRTRPLFRRTVPSPRWSSRAEIRAPGANCREAGNCS